MGGGRHWIDCSKAASSRKMGNGQAGQGLRRALPWTVGPPGEVAASWTMGPRGRASIGVWKGLQDGRARARRDADLRLQPSSYRCHSLSPAATPSPSRLLRLGAQRQRGRRHLNPFLFVIHFLLSEENREIGRHFVVGKFPKHPHASLSHQDTDGARSGHWTGFKPELDNQARREAFLRAGEAAPTQGKVKLDHGLPKKIPLTQKRMEAVISDQGQKATDERPAGLRRNKARQDISRLALVWQAGA